MFSTQKNRHNEEKIVHRDFGAECKKIHVQKHYHYNSKDQFDDVPISTKTIVCVTNWTIDIDALFHHLRVADYQIGKRERKRKVQSSDEFDFIPFGSILTLKYKNQMKGKDLKQKGSPYHLVERSTGGSFSYFPNSLTIVMMLDKVINFKLSKQGKIQFTGCKLLIHAEQCVEILYKLIQDIQSSLPQSKRDDFFKVSPYTTTQGQHLAGPMIVFKTVMTNKDIRLDFNINRQKLDRYIQENTNYYSTTETSQDYTGINIKIAANIPEDYILPLITWESEKKKWISHEARYADYLAMLNERERKKETTKSRFHTFLIFYSGSVICSTPYKTEMNTLYPLFISTIIKNKQHFEETVS